MGRKRLMTRYRTEEIWEKTNNVNFYDCVVSRSGGETVISKKFYRRYIYTLYVQLFDDKEKEYH